MKKFIVILSIICSLFLYACGSGGGGGGDETVNGGNAPKISNFTYSPTSAQQGDGKGAVSIDGQIDFIDADGDIVEFVEIETFKGVEETSKFSLDSYTGDTSGTIYLVGSIPTLETGIPLQGFI